ncbi:psbJ [Symbiodinium natans]|uniref:PsbJ protein n=1 Tax=Symbiodinium natans TaxID=878477 RepID=A0A812U7T6_9DINO|nr:psbJ [Symbiodinium natans]
MKEQLESEAEEEADLMEKYNCWCKENGKEKEKAILEARASIKEWETRITELTAISSSLATEYKNLQEEVDRNEASLDESVALRKKQVAKFQEDEREMFNNLNAVRSAQVALNTSSFPSFLQRPPDASVRQLRAVAERQGDYLKSESRQQLMAFLQDPTSGSVRGVIDGLETDFDTSLKELHDEELQNKAAYEKLVSAKRKEIDSAKVQIATKKEEKTAADEERLQKKQAVKDAKGSVEEDLAFAKKVQEQCDAKGKEWDARQKLRSNEMQAVSKTIEILDSDESFDLFGRTMTPSFLQMTSKKGAAMPEQIYDKLLALGKSHDTRLVTLSLQAKVDGLAKVRKQIDAMVAALKEEQAAEVKKKDYCIEELQKNRLAAADKTREGEEFSAAAEDLKQKVKALDLQTAEVQAQVAGLKKQQKLAAQNREKENAEFQKTVQEQRQTQVLLKKALGVLAAFYNTKGEGSFLQKAHPKEPDTFGGYKKSSANNGVMMMLQQLIADAQEMEAESTAAEREAQKDYEDFGKETIASLATKDKELEDQAEQKAKLTERMVQARQSKKGAEAEVANLAGLEGDLHESCDFTVQNFDARQKARNDEVEALLEAKSNLSGAK